MTTPHDGHRLVVVRGQRVQASSVIGDVQIQVGHPGVRSRRHPLGHYAQRQGKVSTPVGHLGERGTVVPGPRGTDDPLQEGDRFGGHHRAQRDRVGALVDQTGQSTPAGHDHRAAGRAGQQRTHLLRIGGVVQKDEHPPVVHQRPVHSRARFQVRGYVSGRNAQCAQESLQHVLDPRGRTGRETAEVDVEITIGKALSQAMRPPHDQCRLPHSRRTADSGQRCRFRRPLAALVQRDVEPEQVVRAAGEIRDVGRQLSRCRYPALDRCVDVHAAVDQPGLHDGVEGTCHGIPGRRGVVVEGNGHRYSGFHPPSHLCRWRDADVTEPARRSTAGRSGPAATVR